MTDATHDATTDAGAGAGPDAGAERTEAELVSDLAALGVRPGDTLMVQASLRGIGPVRGGSAAVAAALRRALGPTGTLVAYAATPENSDTSRQFRAATAGLDPASVQRYRASLPAFDPRSTPCSPTVGRLSEEIRTLDGALRSAHPQTSFTAVGPDAEEITRDHRPECHLGEESPLGRLYKLGGSVLLAGLPDWLCTAYHLAEYQVDWRPLRRYGCAVRDAGGARRWLEFTGLDLDDRHFPRLGAAVRARVEFGRGLLGAAECFRVPVVEAVDAARGWLSDPSNRALF
ncbi:AAC(3) family N-acetyltransferase [Streptacidiphilus sp. PB12-B1b]|uniref:aminoglycoside N(3)-acetyltransferase n=1 Tax=Streptacidiphilus sp. PB12-B1b TaxID=2705012 RepID=UPI0015F799FF|nr:AAC(3) family N-acetyltransferase [Streptacidiphilus sp. PB12-B1b]QMU74967.1 AAC(3) family N-acetyltransferase [Streptacidiphilus sp. PB12-B1b]